MISLQGQNGNVIPNQIIKIIPWLNNDITLLYHKDTMDIPLCYLPSWKKRFYAIANCQQTVSNNCQIFVLALGGSLKKKSFLCVSITLISTI